MPEVVDHAQGVSEVEELVVFLLGDCMVELGRSGKIAHGRVLVHDADVETFSLVEELRPAPATQKPIGRDKIKQIPAWPIDWERLEQAHGIAYLRGDLATSSPESYTLEEMREICEAMEANTDEIDADMRSEFEQMPQRLRLRCWTC